MAGNVDFTFRKRNAFSGLGLGTAHATSIGRPGLPSSMQRFVAHRMRPRLRGMGQSAADVISNAAAQAQSPFVTPAMLANQALVVQNECAVDPSSPACAAGTASGDIYTGGSPSSDAVFLLNQYCKQNAFNANNFNDSGDPGCPNGVPTAALLQQASTVGYTPAQIAAQVAYTKATGTPVGVSCAPGQTYSPTTGTCVGFATAPAPSNITSGGGSGTQGGGPVLTVTTAPTPPPTPPTTQTMPNVQTANNVGTSGTAAGSLINGQPVSGASATTNQTDYTPYLLAAAAVVVLLMVSK